MSVHIEPSPDTRRRHSRRYRHWTGPRTTHGLGVFDRRPVGVGVRPANPRRIGTPGGVHVIYPTTE